MKVLRFTTLIVFVTVLTFAGGKASQAATIVDFESFVLPPAQDGSPGGYLNGSDGAGGFMVDGVFFNNNYNNYNTEYESWSGFSISNHTDTTTAGSGNQYSAYPGSGAADTAGNGMSSQYAVAFWASYSSPSVFINLPTDSIAMSVDLTNTTYAALSMKDGDGFAKKFGGVAGDDADYFYATFTGYSDLNGTGSTTGSLDFYLADYRSADKYILDTWSNFDLTPLGDKLRSISIEFTSSDNGAWGMNTPAFLAMDNLIISAVPEPSSLALLGLVTGVAVMVRRRRKSIA